MVARHQKKWMSMPDDALIKRLKKCRLRMTRAFAYSKGSYWRWSDYQMYLLNELQWRNENPRRC